MVATDPNAPLTNPPASSAKSWVTTTHTVTALSMTHSCASSKAGSCATGWHWDKETSVPPVTTVPPHSVTPKPKWLRWPCKWSVISTKIPSTFRTTTTANSKNPPSYRPATPTCWSTAQPVLQWVWPPRFRRTTCAKPPTVFSGTWTTQKPPVKNCLNQPFNASRVQTSHPEPKSL